MKKYSAVLLILVFCAFGTAAQEVKKDNVEELPGGFSIGNCGPCGCDGATASRWDIIYGKAVTIVDSDTIVVEAFRVSDDEITSEENKKLFTIDLIGIDAGGNEAAVIMYLQKNILNQRVNASVKWKTGGNLQNSGIIEKVDGKKSFAVNEYLLEKGFVKYKKIGDDALDDEGVTDCAFRLFEKKASDAKSGIWAK